MRKNLARAAAVIALGVLALGPVSGTAFADGNDGPAIGFAAGHGSFTNIGGPYGITHAEGGFIAGGAE
ncbi:hypothetical protein [Streptomyces fuscigenes]|uniref:hypothetical protein n=1 Tax=Streptomyces fuscigenes TaxID=1528880 RepID=UPI001F187339|nr:hypothetical protein [Streptomyces fuscigenes]MCF3961871.1 hypothetical protein [Streptomyces fuscigenes]